MNMTDTPVRMGVPLLASVAMNCYIKLRNRRLRKIAVLGAFKMRNFPEGCGKGIASPIVVARVTEGCIGPYTHAVLDRTFAMTAEKP